MCGGGVASSKPGYVKQVIPCFQKVWFTQGPAPHLCAKTMVGSARQKAATSSPQENVRKVRNWPCLEGFAAARDAVKVPIKIDYTNVYAVDVDSDTENGRSGDEKTRP